MRTCSASRTVSAMLAASLWCIPASVLAQTIAGEPVDPGQLGPGVIETLAQIVERDRLTPPPVDKSTRQLGETGSWVVPSEYVRSFPHSGQRNVLNKWGDTRMGIGFPQTVSLKGAYFAAQTVGGEHTPAVRIIGYRDGHEIARTEWFAIQGAMPAWFDATLADVDRIEVESAATAVGPGWYSLDDLTYVVGDGQGASRTVVVDFEDVAAGTTLSGKQYASLSWESGQGDFDGDDSIHGPLAPSDQPLRAGPVVEASADGTRAVTPTLMNSFQSVLRGDAGSNSYPPDTCGAVGPNHFVTVVNRNVAIYNRTTGAEISNVLLTSFQPGTNGDPRVCYDQFSSRWIILSTNFSSGAQIFLAISLTSDPTGSWFKTSFNTAAGADAGAWPDYPTLGVDQNGIYTAAYMVGGASGMTIFAIDKAPLIAPSPSLGTVTAFRSLPWEGAIQPVFTYGYPGGEYLVSWLDSDTLRVRRVNPPLTSPTLTEVGSVNVPSFSSPPLASAPGSSPGLNTVDERLMMSVYRNDSIWTCHTINVGGRAGCRWYQIDTSPLVLTQSGNVGDPVRHYFFPSIMINNVGDAVMGFTGSSSSEPASCYYTGRRLADAPGEMAAPVRYKLGVSGYNLIDSYGRNRWGDYSLTTLDPDDGTRFLTIQEYAHAPTTWGTYVAELRLAPPDCNNNGIPDNVDIGFGSSEDCNDNGIPDECEVPPLAAGGDCNANGVPDECDLASGTSFDCNANGLIDECDILAGTSDDCQPNGVPDECEIGLAPFALRFNLNSNPGWTTTGPQWQFGQPTGNGGLGAGEPDPTSGFTGTNVYGVNLNGDYSLSPGGPYFLQTTALDLSLVRDVHFRFQRWLNTSEPPYVRSKAEISNNATSWSTLWEHSGDSPITSNAWTLQDFDISAYATNQPTVYIRWSYQVSPNAWGYSGWNVDDIEITGERYGGTGDCNGNAIPDACDIAGGAAQDCNNNAVPDSCDIAGGASEDANGNGVPDECEAGRLGDLNCDGVVDFFDIDPFVAALSGQAVYQAQYPDCRWLNADCDQDGDVDFFDIDAFVALLGT